MREKFVKLIEQSGASGELSILNIDKLSLSFENGKFKNIEEGKNGGIAVRVVKDGKLGFSFSTNTEDVESVVNESLTVSKFGDKVDFQFVEGGSIDKKNFYDERIEKEERKKFIEEGEKVIEELKTFKKEIEPFFYMERDIITKHIITTNGFEGRIKKTVITFALGGQIVREGDFLAIYDSKSFSSMDLVNIKSSVEKVKEQFINAENTTTIETGTYPVIFTPKASSMLLLPLSLALNGRYVVKGLSLLKDKIGEKIFSESFSVYDKPLLVGGAGSMEIDDEGSITREKVLIDKGVVRSFLTDLDSGKKLSLEGGNALKKKGLTGEIDLEAMPSPSFTNAVIEEGKEEYINLLRSIKRGLIIDSLMGVMMGNVLGGEVNGNIELGFLVENGEIVGRVKNATLKLNIFKDLTEIYPSKEREWYGSTLSPYLLIPKVSISGK